MNFISVIPGLEAAIAPVIIFILTQLIAFFSGLKISNQANLIQELENIKASSDYKTAISLMIDEKTKRMLKTYEYAYRIKLLLNILLYGLTIFFLLLITNAVLVTSESENILIKLLLWILTIFIWISIFVPLSLTLSFYIFKIAKSDKANTFRDYLIHVSNLSNPTSSVGIRFMKELDPRKHQRKLSRKNASGKESDREISYNVKDEVISFFLGLKNVIKLKIILLNQALYNVYIPNLKLAWNKKKELYLYYGFIIIMAIFVIIHRANISIWLTEILSLVPGYTEILFILPSMDVFIIVAIFSLFVILLLLMLLDTKVDKGIQEDEINILDVSK